MSHVCFGGGESCGNEGDSVIIMTAIRPKGDQPVLLHHPKALCTPGAWHLSNWLVQGPPAVTGILKPGAACLSHQHFKVRSWQTTHAARAETGSVRLQTDVQHFSASPKLCCKALCPPRILVDTWFFRSPGVTCWLSKRQRPAPMNY